MRDLLSGSHAACGELYRRHSAFLFGLALTRCHSRPDAEDILHDVFLEAWNRAASYDPARGSVVAWLAIRLKSRTLDFLVRSRRQQALFFSSDADLFRCDARSDMTADRTPIVRVLSNMRKTSAQLLIAAHVEHSTCTEIATTFGIPAGTVKSRLAAAKDQFRAELRRRAAATTCSSSMHDELASIRSARSARRSGGSAGPAIAMLRHATGSSK